MGLSDLIAGGMDATAATELLLNVIWTIVGATLVYFMQAGFAMCEAGFTRAKNTGNILMKNMMDFVLGSLFFFIFGFAIMHGTDWNGIIGIKGFFNPTTLADADGLFNGLPIGVFLIFHTVFCATSATIVSGSMAERTKFLAYLLYSAAISIFIYPVTGHWIWGGGWLAQMGFHDFAGSTAVHMVGGICALVGAKILGPRIGKYDKDGYLYITGRNNRYIKMFGKRINLDEVEHQLTLHLKREVFVSAETEKILIISVEKLGHQLVDWCAKTFHLPQRAFEIIKREKIPRKSNGKVDYGKL
mgnify:CR=1 FL=1